MVLPVAYRNVDADLDQVKSNPRRQFHFLTVYNCTGDKNVSKKHFLEFLSFFGVV